MGRKTKPNKITRHGAVAKIHLHGQRGGIAVIDAEDAERVQPVASWYLLASGLVSATGGRSGAKKYLHRFVMDAPPDLNIDFEDGDKLNCRKKNLFTVVKPKAARWGENGGVYFSKGKWRAHPCINGKKTSLGYFATKEEAQAAVRAAVPRDNRRIKIDLELKRPFRAYGRGGHYLGSFDTEEEARAARDGFEAGTWKKPGKTPGVSFDAMRNKWRADGRDGQYLGRFRRKELALAAQTVYHQSLDDDTSTHQTIPNKGTRRNKGACR
jgi:hypothetical protein